MDVTTSSNIVRQDVVSRVLDNTFRQTVNTTMYACMHAVTYACIMRHVQRDPGVTGCNHAARSVVVLE